MNDPCMKALILNISTNKGLLYTFWATAQVTIGRTECWTEYEYIQGFIPSKDDAKKLESFDITLTGFRKLV